MTTDFMKVRPMVTVTVVKTPEDVETLRRLRNVTRGTYSDVNDEITPEQQAAWWDAESFNMVAYLLHEGDAAAMENAVGFGLLRLINSEIVSEGLPLRIEPACTTTVGVLPSKQGKGYGYQLMKLLKAAAQMHRCALVAQARLDNPAGMKMHQESEGWREIRHDAKYAYYRMERPGFGHG